MSQPTRRKQKGSHGIAAAADLNQLVETIQSSLKHEKASQDSETGGGSDEGSQLQVEHLPRGEDT